MKTPLSFEFVAPPEGAVLTHYDRQRVSEALAEFGFAILQNTDADIETLIRHRGHVIQSSRIEAREDRNRLAMSAGALAPHTDHARADYIAWKCITAAPAGGASILVDGREVLRRVDAKHHEALEGVRITEHAVFEGDEPDVPLLRWVDGEPRFYYTFWLASEPAHGDRAAAWDAWQQAVADTPHVRFRLTPGDVLIVDNRRVFHGRTAFDSQSGRCLERYWISEAGPVAVKADTGARRTDYVLQLPESITPERVLELRKAGLDADIAGIDLSMVKMKMQDPDEGAGWSAEQSEMVEVDYKRFLQLNRAFPDAAIVPTSDIDKMWHFHILDTRAYVADSQRVFGEYFHHYPYFGMRGDEDAEALESAFRDTVMRWEQAFGELPKTLAGGKCWHDCQGRCWHACSNIDVASPLPGLTA